MKIALPILLVTLSGCATTSPQTAGRGGAETRVTLAATGPAQRSSGGSTQTVGLPLTRAQKIGLWAGVAVLLGYLMADSNDDEDSAASSDP